MSGAFRTGRNSISQPKLEKRPELVKGNPDSPIVLPERTEIRVIASMNKRLDPLARVSKKFQVAGQPTLSFELDDYIVNAPIDTTNSEHSRQALQCCLHEMMHMALWDDASISHNPDKTSLLYYYVDGSVLTPNAWDIEIIKESAKRIGSIVIEMRELRLYNIDFYMREAARLWNQFVGREFYKLL